MDTADSVTVNVPGATTTVTSMPEKVKAAAALLAQANRARSGSYAVVSWIGYRAPQFHEVGMPYVAKAGAPRLAGFLDGLHESRSKNPAASINVTAHSYGSTTASYALQQTKHPVDAFLSYGSMAPPTFLCTDPLRLPWVETFASEGPGDGATVTGHDMFHEGGGQVGYLSPGAASTQFMGGVIAERTGRNESEQAAERGLGRC